MSDRTKIEITPEMIETGEQSISSLGGAVDSAYLVSQVYIATA
jgi:hypothetical protein